MALIDTLQEKFGAEFHPAFLLAEVVQDETQDLRLRIDCAKVLIPYTTPSLKAVQVRGSIDHNLGLLRVEDYSEVEEILDIVDETAAYQLTENEE